MLSLLTPEALARDLSIRDLTDPATGPHALQLLVAEAAQALHAAWRCDVLAHRSHPIVPVTDNYDALGYRDDAIARDARYSRYVSETCMLRAHTTAMLPPLLRAMARTGAPSDRVLVCPGLVYRRDAIDRLHTGTPHQLDLWRITTARTMAVADLYEMMAVVVRALLPGVRYRAIATSHPYTVHGRQIDVAQSDTWVEVGECGVAAPEVLAAAGLDPDHVSGLAMGLGLDRVLMVRKWMPDIRLLRSTDPRVASQMLDLAPYRGVSVYPPVVRDLSFAVAADATRESIGDRVRDALDDATTAVESVELLSETDAEDLPEPARARLGISPGHKNVLLRLVLRDLDRTLTAAEANVLRDRVHAAVHEGRCPAEPLLSNCS